MEMIKCERKELSKSKSKEYIHEYNLKYNKGHKDEIREKRRANREKENLKRKTRMKEIYIQSREHKSKMGYGHIHSCVCRIIKRLGIRPNSCPICGYKCNPVAHHPDYTKPYEIIFCCNSCHKLIHLGQLDIDKTKIIKLCENEGDKQLIRCKFCGTLIHKIGGTKYCKKCKLIANRLNQKKFREKKKLLNI